MARISQGSKGRDQYHVVVSGKPELLRFAVLVGAVGARRDRELQGILHYLERRQENTNRDVIPIEAWSGPVRQAAAQAGITHRELQKDIGMAYAGMTLFKQNLSRDRARRVATAAGCERVLRLAESDVYWDQVVAIEPDGVEEVFDLTVPGPHNFVADDVIVHNSLEQDSDLVLFIYRDEVYNQDSAQKGIAEIHLSKHRNGPIGKIELAFLEHYTKFANLARGV
jgi:replicative DNA helicase